MARQDHDRGEDENTVRLLALGVDHRSAPASVREALAFDGTKYAAGLDLLAQTFPGNEFVILSTCNRVELYVAGSPEQVPETDALTDVLAKFHGVKSEVFSAHLVSYHDEGAHRPFVPGGGQPGEPGPGGRTDPRPGPRGVQRGHRAEDRRPDLPHRVSDRAPRRQAGP